MILIIRQWNFVRVQSTLNIIFSSKEKIFSRRMKRFVPCTFVRCNFGLVRSFDLFCFQFVDTFSTSKSNRKLETAISVNRHQRATCRKIQRACFSNTMDNFFRYNFDLHRFSTHPFDHDAFVDSDAARRVRAMQYFRRSSPESRCRNSRKYHEACSVVNSLAASFLQLQIL